MRGYMDVPVELPCLFQVSEFALREHVLQPPEVCWLARCIDGVVGIKDMAERLDVHAGRWVLPWPVGKLPAIEEF